MFQERLSFKDLKTSVRTSFVRAGDFVDGDPDKDLSWEMDSTSSHKQDISK